ALTGFARAPLERLRRNGHANSETIWALKDVSFEVYPGEVVGIIGRNGAGKSTLLKILSRITEPTTGRVELYGRVGSLLEVGTGFHPELTGRENIYLNGAILGMTRREIDKKFDEIVDFAEIEKFIDTPVKHYSSGMYMRLAFAVAAHLDPEILLVDEVLAVGDVSFQRKCLGKMGDIARKGRTVIFVSHNMAAVKDLCNVSLWLDDGEKRSSGLATKIVSEYLKEINRSKGEAICEFEEDPEKDFQLCSAKLLNYEGKNTKDFSCDEPVVIELLCRVVRPVPGLYGYLSIIRTDGMTVLVSDTFDVPPNPLDNLPVGKHVVRITIPQRTLGPGDYGVYLNFASPVGIKGFDIESPGIVLAFRLSDWTSKRGNSRLGFFSTLLPWVVEEIEE
ncbi:ABC transporter ATP-binding protein, partial [Thermogemmatispora sp.]|uniref:ABC transporter ATP-binding protein n=1 Tax=Thermogemmatispora sp. TaxID=1968838 RepID=UPI0035E3F609